MQDSKGARKTPAPKDRGLCVFVKAPPGFDDVLVSELEAIFAAPWIPRKSPPQVEREEGGALVSGLTANDVHEILFRTRCAEDVEWILHDARCHDMVSFLKAFEPAALARLVPKGVRVAPAVDSISSHLFHEGDLKRALVKHLGTNGWTVAEVASESVPDDPRAVATPVRARLKNNRRRVNISLASLALGRRGYKAAQQAYAPLREEQAAACLATVAALGSLPAEGPVSVWVPFAGSGTFGFEAVQSLFGFNLAPLTSAPFPARELPFWSEKTWAHLLKRQNAHLAAQARRVEVTFVEKHAEAADTLEANVARVSALCREAGLPESSVTFKSERADFFQSQAPVSSGALLVPLNPPYGLRIAREAELYSRIGKKVAQMASAAPVAGCVLCASEDDWRSFTRALPPARAPKASADEKKAPVTRQFTQGGLGMRLCAFTLGGSPG